jgi:beta-lactamase superfamily II metal-dependent hydrolase
VHFIDVGQGDSMLIIAPNGASMLIDGGEPSEGLKVVSYAKSLGITVFNTVVCTHPHSDHLGGLITVLQQMTVLQVLDSGQVSATQTFKEYMNVIRQKNIPFKVVKHGDAVNLDPSIQVEVLSPPPQYFTGTRSDPNANSIVLKVTYMQISFLFAADAEAETEAYLNRFNIDCDVLKVPHHGSKYSSSPAFLQSVSPLIGVIEVGANNQYGHPHQETLVRYASVGAFIYRTDWHGTVIASTDGRSLVLSPERGAPSLAYVKYGGQTFNMTLKTSSKVTDLAFNQPSKQISFKVSGRTGTFGSMQITMPNALLGGPYAVTFDGNPIQAQVSQSNGESTIQFSYTHSAHYVSITGATAIPELRSAKLILPLAVIVTLHILRRKRKIVGRIWTHV